MFVMWRLIIGSAAAICTTIAFIPQLIKIKRRGGRDLSYPMLFLYLSGVVLWLCYGIMIQAEAVIAANAVTSLLVAACLLLKWAQEKAPPARDKNASPQDSMADETATS